jgi:hypothetical protein
MGNSIELPVFGRDPRAAIMSAVNDSGTTLLLYRLAAHGKGWMNLDEFVETAVNPVAEIIPDIDLVIAATAFVLLRIFDLLAPRRGGYETSWYQLSQVCQLSHCWRIGHPAAESRRSRLAGGG